MCVCMCVRVCVLVGYVIVLVCVYFARNCCKMCKLTSVCMSVLRFSMHVVLDFEVLRLSRG